MGNDLQVRGIGHSTRASRISCGVSLFAKKVLVFEISSFTFFNLPSFVVSNLIHIRIHYFHVLPFPILLSSTFLSSAFSLPLPFLLYPLSCLLDPHPTSYLNWPHTSGILPLEYLFV